MGKDNRREEMAAVNVNIPTMVLFLRWLTLTQSISSPEENFDDNPNLQLIHDSSRQLEGGKHVHYHVPNNIFPSQTALKVVLDSLSGDADLYVSSSAKESKPTYLSYDYKAASFGMDIVDVPLDMKRPLAIGIYSHPNYKSSKFRMRIFVDHYNSVDEFSRVRSASSSDERTYEELASERRSFHKEDKQLVDKDRGKPKSPKKDVDIGGKKTAHRGEEKSSWLTTLLLHILEFLLEVFL